VRSREHAHRFARITLAFCLNPMRQFQVRCFPTLAAIMMRPFQACIAQGDQSHMSKQRYVFWRTPTGKPYLGGDQKFALVEILAEIGKTAGLSGQGLSWSGFSLHRFETSLKASLVVAEPEGSELNESDTWTLVWAAIRTIIKRQGGGKPIASSDLLHETDAGAATYFRKIPDKYILLSTLSVTSLPAKSVRIRRSVVRRLSGTGGRFRMPPVLEQHRRHSPPPLRLAHYQTIGVTTVGRSVNEAISQALDDLTLLRGLWTLLSASGSWRISFGSTERKPLGVMHVGPIHTLHHPGGEFAVDSFWHEPDSFEDANLYEPSDGWDRVEKERRWTLRRMKSLPYRRDLEDLIARYAIALDQMNPDITFLHLWSILEKLTDTIGANYDETVRRAVWAYRDRKLAGEMLESMRLHRNRLVHTARSSEKPDQIAYMVKSFVEPHLRRLIRNDFEIDSLEEYGRYLALPANLDTLEKQHRRLGRAIRQKRKWDKN
jgi:hypothetical protein